MEKTKSFTHKRVLHSINLINDFSHVSEVIYLFKVGKKKSNQSLKNKYFGMYNIALEIYFKELEE